MIQTMKSLLLATLLLLTGCADPHAQDRPVTKLCTATVEMLFKQGVWVEAGQAIRVDARWTAHHFDFQQAAAECLSHVKAGGQNKWADIEFVDATGQEVGRVAGGRYVPGSQASVE